MAWRDLARRDRELPAPVLGWLWVVIWADLTLGNLRDPLFAYNGCRWRSAPRPWKSTAPA